MNDIKHIKRFCKRFGIGFHIFTDIKFIHTDAVKEGAVKTLSLYNKINRCALVDLNFDAKDSFVGYSDEWNNSLHIRKTNDDT